MNNETAWLIEHISRPAWVSNSSPCGLRNRWYWGTAHEAIRFCRQEDAFRTSLLLGLTPADCKITEHLWCDAAPKPEPAESPAEPAQDDEYRSLDHACKILRGCVAPYSGEQAHAVAKVLKQWRDKWAAAVDCIHPDERQTIAALRAEVAEQRDSKFELAESASKTIADLRAKLAAAEARIAEMRNAVMGGGDYSSCLAKLRHIAELGKGGA